MKTYIIKLTSVAILGTFLAFAAAVAKADVTLTVGPGTTTNSYFVPSNVIAKVVHTYLFSGGQFVSDLYVSTPETTNGLAGAAHYVANAPNFEVSNPPTIVGPATITLTSHTSVTAGLLSYCTIQTSSAIALSFTPSSSVVIPNDGGGPVTIIMESSTDLINWVAANPGTYGTTSSNRFFRVRAQR